MVGVAWKYLISQRPSLSFRECCLYSQHSKAPIHFATSNIILDHLNEAIWLMFRELWQWSREELELWKYLYAIHWIIMSESKEALKIEWNVLFLLFQPILQPQLAFRRYRNINHIASFRWSNIMLQYDECSVNYDNDLVKNLNCENICMLFIDTKTQFQGEVGHWL